MYGLNAVAARRRRRRYRQTMVNVARTRAHGTEQDTEQTRSSSKWNRRNELSGESNKESEEDKEQIKCKNPATVKPTNRTWFMQTCTVDETEEKEKHIQNTKYIIKVILKHVACMKAEMSFGTANEGETSWGREERRRVENEKQEPDSQANWSHTIIISKEKGLCINLLDNRLPDNFPLSLWQADTFEPTITQ